MLLTVDNITIVIVTFKSEKIIEQCLNSIDSQYSIIVVENSTNVSFKKNIENKLRKTFQCIFFKYLPIRCYFGLK